MRAVILAAGAGERMKDAAGSGHLPKPLLPLLGLPLIERAILTAKKAGITDFVIVTGYQGQKIKDFCRDGSRWGVTIDYADNPRWPEGNAGSLLAALPFFDREERFLVLMADHLLEPKLLTSFLDFLQEEKNGEAKAFLAVDRRLQSVYQLEEATKVQVDEEGIIRLLGKNISDFNGVDCGCFCFSPAVLAELASAVEKGWGNLSQALSPVLDRGDLRAFQIGDCFWLDVDEPADLELAKKKLLSMLASPRDGVVARYFNRPLSLRLTSLLVSLPFKPNFYSAINGLMCLAASLLFALGFGFMGGILAQTASIIDGVDGEVARLKYQETAFGAYFDSIIDRYSDALLIGGMTAGLIFAQGGQQAALFPAFLALAASPLSMLSKEKMKNLTGKEYYPQEEGWLSYLPVNRDGRLAIIALGGIFNLEFIALWLLALMANLQVIYRLIKARGILAS
ncbi:MAG: sugar phosphate nucleotidyltransferase [Bacillota bacterium]